MVAWGLIALLAGGVTLVLCLIGWLFMRTRHRRKGLPAASLPDHTVPVRMGAPGGASIQDGEAVPSRIGAYLIERQIGRGSMGVVYLASKDGDTQRFAIKTMGLSREFDASALKEAKERFFREAQTAQRLDHAGIVKVFDSGQDGDLAWIAMEYLSGQDLIKWTEAGNLLPLSDVLAVVRQAALALDYAHKKQVVHRDIKPGNLMYDPATHKIKITDFGIARLTDTNRTRTGLVLGTPAFMSPEQLAGKHIDARSDLFSLGVLLYQLLTGKLPFHGNSMAELMHAIINQQADDPRLHNPKIPAPLAAIVTKAMQKDISARFQSGAQFALALARLEAALKGK